MYKMNNLKIYVIHVRGEKEREKHMRQELEKFKLEAEFMLDGNKEDITPQTLTQYFTGSMHEVSGKVSCALKHIKVYESIISNKIEQALIFEDDIILKSNFESTLHDVLEEIKERQLSNYFISLENSNHGYIKKHEREAGKHLYEKKQGRCAGAYLIDYQCAQSLIQEIKYNKCGEAIDWFHNQLLEQQKITIYWAHPYLAEQGSHNGSFKSLIDNKPSGWFRKMVYYFQRVIKSKRK